MNSPVLVSAPGKVVLSGEYAVLDGAPAVCMAVNRRARVSMRAIGGNESRVTAPGFNDTVGKFRTQDGALNWSAGGEPYAILDAAWQACTRRPVGAIELVLDSSQFIDKISGKKLGIGSSAAVTVALCAVVNGEDGVAKAAHGAHDTLHRGSGSGVDVACSLHGGLIEYRRDEKQVRELNWPSQLHFKLVWTGVAVSTADKVAQLNAGEQHPSRVQLGRAAESLANCWRMSDSQALIEEYADYTEHLQSFSREHKLGIFDAGHAELLNTARSAGLVYKPCGAGGGDIGIVLGTDAGKLDAFTRALPAQFAVIDCAMDRSGFRFEDQQ